MENPINMKASALIVSRKGSLRDGLVALLGAMPRLAAVETADSLEDALTRNDLETASLILVLDARSVDPDLRLAVRRIKAAWRGTVCIVVADTVDQQEQAVAAGADAVLINGFPPARLDDTLVKLLPQSDDSGRAVLCVCDRTAKGHRPRAELHGPGHAQGSASP